MVDGIHEMSRVGNCVLWVQPPVPTKGARRVAELASKRFLRERIRLTQRAKGDAKRETESTAEGITATLTANEASDILEKIRVNTQRVFNATKDRQQRKFLKLVQEKQASVSPHVNLTCARLSASIVRTYFKTSKAKIRRTRLGKGRGGGEKNGRESLLAFP